MPKHPISGISGSKPRLDKSPQEEARERFEANSLLDRVYKERRNQILDLRYKREAMALALQRDQLVEKGLALKQLSFLLISMRQQLLALPLKIGSRFGNRPVETREVVAYAKRLVNETLTELAKLPECVEPEWLEKLEEEALASDL
jgi:hypothetical protein